MTVIVCLDNANGMMFNHRRQSRDANVVKDILKTINGASLLIAPYSEPLFSQAECSVSISDSFLADADAKDYYNHRDEKGCYFSINTPKTKAGEREIPMTEGVKQAFLMEREFQSQAEISSKSRVDGYDDFIFVNRYGDVQNQGNLNKALRRMMRDCNDEILEKYGADSDPVLLPQFSCHILRHTFATRLCESGANLKFIQSILGHADVSTTMNIYVDVTDALKKKEITAFDDYMTTKLET